MTHTHGPVTAPAREGHTAGRATTAARQPTPRQRLQAAINRIGNTNANALLRDRMPGAPVCPVEVGSHPAGVQAKPTMSRPGDPDEREADSVADHIMASNRSQATTPTCSTCAASGTSCPKCAQERKIQRTPAPGASHASVPQVSALRGGGTELTAPIRSFFEPHFGADLTNVRIHTDDAADRAARSIGARAYTLGSDIAFARNEFAPDSDAGRRLLAHELTHVVQQSQSGPAQHISRDVGGAMDTPAAPGAAPKVPEAPSQKPDVAPEGQTMIFEGVLLGTNIEYVTPVMRQYIATHGEGGAKDFRKRLGEHVNKRIPESDKSALEMAEGIKACPTEPLSNDAQIYVAVNESLEELFRTNKIWLADFEHQAHDVVLGMLKESEDRVTEEMIRYGIDWKTVQRTRYRQGRGGMIAYQADVTEYSMQDTPGSHALAEAATGLLTRKQTYDTADKALKDYAEERNLGAFGELVAGRVGGRDRELEHLDELYKTRATAKRDLDVFRIQKSGEFPILAAYASEEEISEGKLKTLQELASGKSPAATNLMGEEVKTRLEHIADVRDDIEKHNGEKTKVWRVPRIVEGTRAATGALPGTMYGRLVEDKVHDEEPGFWTSILIGLLQLVLVLAAPFTAGLTLIPAAAISGYQAYTHFREYERAQMLHGTDFGAMALSSEDPSLFWLAVDIIGAGFDVGAAAGAAITAFRALAPAARAVRAARAARNAAALEEAAVDLERAATEVGGAELARTVGRDARLGAEAMAVGQTTEEAQSLARAGESLAAKEFTSGAGEAKGIAGRTVKVSEGGALWTCASPCTMFRERYKSLLRDHPEWLEEVKKLEDEAAQIPKDAADAAARRQDLAKRAAGLEEQMRTKVGKYADKVHSSAEFDEMLSRRGSAAAELDHHPENWTGAEEAEFRYGKGVKAEPGYRFTLDNEGRLRYDRLDINRPPKRFNPDTGMFEEVTGAGKFHRAHWGTETPTPVATLPEAQQKAMAAAFEKRGAFLAKRDELEELQKLGPLTKENSEALSKVYAQINEQSRLMGEEAAEGIMRSKPGSKKLYPLAKTHSTSGDFDQVWKQGDRFQLVEGKGGSSGLGSRAISEGERAEQGTIEYAQSIAKNMATKGATPEIRKLGDELLVAIAEGKVDYVLVRAPIGEKLGAAVMKDVQVSQFVLKPAAP
jgi:Domain of unknown function (DUF4157)